MANSLKYFNVLIFHLKRLPQQLQLFPVPCKTQAVRHYHFWKWVCICLGYMQAISGQKPYLSSHHPVFTFKQWPSLKVTSHAPECLVGGEEPGRNCQVPTYLTCHCLFNHKGQFCWSSSGTILYRDQPEPLPSRLNWRLGIKARTHSGCCSFCPNPSHICIANVCLC